MNIARHFNHRRKQIACSSQDSFAYNESSQGQTGLPPHRSFAHKDPPFFVDGSIFSFQSNQRFRGPTRSGKARHLSH